ncbi:hypothetical protein QJS04_geneDACA000045 [Acorus gramineus]|uniref:Uncharacterized protein n=1 Tax=Acorus gramineus TaxID=55184 RepID=A0AAV9AT17_ACOGR|nr:hypothetical protein QJS04_geneDACA000045 [Acorus gramineus]
MTHFLSLSNLPTFRTPTLIFSSSKWRPTTFTSKPTPARDRVIDFGKHKGQMLGTLPSKYLKWVSKNLRARDFEEWARLADEVLSDPVYKDRVEWESAQRVLDGSGTASESPVSDLLNIADRFGWDNEDKEGWGRIDFGLLGTSKGGRIPRKSRSLGGSEARKMGSLNGGLGFEKVKKLGFSYEQSWSSGSVESGNLGVSGEGKVGILRGGSRYSVEDEKVRFEEEVVMGKRGERRERQRLKRGQQMQRLRREVGVVEGGEGGGDGVQRVGQSGGLRNPFPGRGALLGKIKRPD